MTTLGPPPMNDLALSVFLAPLASGRRVLWIGDAGAGADQLASFADVVRVLDTSGRGRRRRGGAARVSLYRPGRLSFQAGSFDLVVVADIECLDHPEDRFAELSAILADGVLVVGTRVGDDAALANLQSQLQTAFREVRVLGQAAFRGVALADLTAGHAEEVCVDGSLLGSETEDLTFVFGMAADELPPTDPYLVVQLPNDEASEADATEPSEMEEALTARRREVDALREALDRAESRLEQAQARLITTEGELAEARAALTDAPPALDSAEIDLGDVAPVSDVVADVVAGLRPDAPADARVEDFSVASDVAELEQKLRDRASHVRALEAEVGSVRLVLRDVVEELREHQLGRRSAVLADAVAAGETAGEAAAGAPVSRLTRELERTEAELSVDELRTTLLERDAALEALRTAQAELSGRVRGLRARAAEIEELRALAEARLAVAKLDLEDRVEKLRQTEASLGDAREQLELAMIRERGAPTPSLPSQRSEAEVAALRESERKLSARVGQLTGQLLLAREGRADAEQERDRARAETLRLMAQLSNLETRVEGLRMGYEMRIAMLSAEPGTASGESATGTDEAIEGELARVSDELQGLRGEREGLRLRLADREASLLALTKAPVSPKTLDELDRLRDEVATLRTTEAELTLAAGDLQMGKSEAEARARDLVAAVASRDALVTRLQMDLAEEEQQRRTFDQRLERVRDERDRLREALVDASGAVERADALAREIDGLRKAAKDHQAANDAAQADKLAAEAALKEAVDALTAAETARDQAVDGADSELQGLQAERDALVQRVDTLLRDRDAQVESLHLLRRTLDAWRAEQQPQQPVRSDITAVGLEAPDATEDGSDRLRREIDDKDTLLRSLTAQLEERNDRIRALERRLAEGGSGSGDDEDARRTLLELQERVERLREELRHAQDARRASEDQVASLQQTPDAVDELGRLEKRLADREAALEDALSRASMFERDVGSLRTVCADARAEIESLLGAIGDEDASARLAALVEVLKTF